MVDYIAFSDAIESVFTMKGLERSPQSEPGIFQGYENGADPTLNVLDENEEKIFQQTIKRLHAKVLERRIDPLSYLEDYDFVREGTLIEFCGVDGVIIFLVVDLSSLYTLALLGTITTNQFRSVLNTINLSVDDNELHILARRFAVDKNMDRVNYR